MYTFNNGEIHSYYSIMLVYMNAFCFVEDYILVIRTLLLLLLLWN